MERVGEAFSTYIVFNETFAAGLYYYFGYGSAPDSPEKQHMLRLCDLFILTFLNQPIIMRAMVVILRY
jgi:hypothetical protein